MASKQFIHLLLTIAALTAISIGLGVGISKRNAASLGRNANLASETTVNFSDDCVDDDVVHRRRIQQDVPRRVRVRTVGESEWPWEAEFGMELAFSLDYSMSVSSKSGKSSKGSYGKSGKSSFGKSGKSSVRSFFSFVSMVARK
jgi:hypothetical protein